MAKREVKVDGGGEVKAPEPMKSVERELGEAMESMVNAMAQKFRSKVFGQLQQSTINKFATEDNGAMIADFKGSFPVTIKQPNIVKRKVSTFTDSAGVEYTEDEVRRFGDYDDPMFYEIKETKTEVENTEYTYSVEFKDMLASNYIKSYGIIDAQIGNFAAIYLTLADRVRRELVRKYDDKRLEKLAKDKTGKVNKRNKSEFYRRIANRIGISREELEATEGLTFQINAYQLETYQWIRKMRDETLQQWTSNTLRLMAEGKSLPELLSQFDNMVEQRRGHAKMVARTQISTFNSLVSKTRARNLGIEKAIWVTSRDERVRPAHEARDGKEFNLADGSYSSIDGKTLLPGTDYNCRCDYKMIIPDSDN
jgi:SPP1 gp7 family putative phage head morphogenesis protein